MKTIEYIIKGSIICVIGLISIVTCLYFLIELPSLLTIGIVAIIAIPEIAHIIPDQFNSLVNTIELLFKKLFYVLAHILY